MDNKCIEKTLNAVLKQHYTSSINTQTQSIQSPKSIAFHQSFDPNSHV